MTTRRHAKRSTTAKAWAVVKRLVVKTLPDTGRIRRAAAAIWMNVLIAAVVVVAFTTGRTLLAPLAPHATWSLRALTLFAIWLLSFMPGWLYVRFLGLRADALWNEYVLNLYRLGLDEPRYLPPPPTESPYARLDRATDGGEERSNIYRQKFNSYYGRKLSSLSSRPSSENFCVSVDTLFPVFLCTATLAVAWSAILWNPVALMEPVEPWATLEFGFLGAYTFATSMLVRRFYQSDLRPSAYAAVVLRIVVVLLILAVVHQLFVMAGSEGTGAYASQYVTAFVVGFFPLVGLQALQRVAGKVLHVVVQQTAPEYPLEQLDGLNIWYEARLAEEGVEDMQNLTTMNLVDVILHTRAPVGRLVDWIDQAFLLIHLNPASRSEIKRARGAAPATADGAVTRVALRRIGVRSATDLLKAFGCGDQKPQQDMMSADALHRRGLDLDQIQTLTRLLADEPGLHPVWNWKDGAAGRIRDSEPNGRPHGLGPARSRTMHARIRHRTASSASSPTLQPRRDTMASATSQS
jgi:hypothetical protein